MSLPLAPQSSGFHTKKTLDRKLSKSVIARLVKDYPSNITFNDSKSFEWKGEVPLVEDLKKYAQRQDWYSLVYEIANEFEAGRSTETLKLRFENFIEKYFSTLNATQKSKIKDLFKILNGYFPGKAHIYQGRYKKGYDEKEFISKLQSFFEFISEFSPSLPAISVREYLDNIIEDYEK